MVLLPIAGMFQKNQRRTTAGNMFAQFKLKIKLCQFKNKLLYYSPIKCSNTFRLCG